MSDATTVTNGPIPLPELLRKGEGHHLELPQLRQRKRLGHQNACSGFTLLPLTAIPVTLIRTESTRKQNCPAVAATLLSNGNHCSRLITPAPGLNLRGHTRMRQQTLRASDVTRHRYERMALPAEPHPYSPESPMSVRDATRKKSLTVGNSTAPGKSTEIAHPVTLRRHGMS
jgi:hypothetical protein